MEEALLASLPHTPPPPLSPPTMDAPALAAAMEEALRAAWGAWRGSSECAARCAAARGALAELAGRPELDAPSGSELARGGAGGAGGAGAPPLAVPASALPWSHRFSFLMDQALAAYEGVRVPRSAAQRSAAAALCTPSAPPPLSPSLAPLRPLQDRLSGRASGGGEPGSASASAMADFAVAVKRLVPRGSAFRAFPIAFNHLSPSRAWCALLASPAAREIIEVRPAVRLSVPAYFVRSACMYSRQSPPHTDTHANTRAPRRRPATRTPATLPFPCACKCRRTPRTLWRRG